MSIGESGRIVLEVDPNMKRRLYAILTDNGLTLKAWFTREATAYIEHSGQRQLFDNSASRSEETTEVVEAKVPNASA